MTGGIRYTASIALIVALGGFLLGFDISVISGVVGFIESDFGLSKLQVGWAVSCLALTSTLGMFVAGPLSDHIGRRPVLKIAAVLFAVSAVTSAIAVDFVSFVLARMLGGLGVGAALVVAPMYIAEIAPARVRGRLVSFNQLNIVVGISVAFFTNYLILTLGNSDAGWAAAINLGAWNWRWMLGIEALPAVAYLLALLAVPESPRWLAMQGRETEALQVFTRASGADRAAQQLGEVRASIAAEANVSRPALGELLQPSLRAVLWIGIVVGVLQQATGINAVFFYAPMIFEQSGIGTDAAFMQAALVGLVNLVFTVVAMATIDRLGRRVLLGIGLTGIAVSMLTLAWAFGSAEIGADGAPVDLNAQLVLFGILGFVACFAMSLGPVMWVLFAELFPNRVRGLAISFVGPINSIVAFLVTLVFPLELEVLGPATTFLIYGCIAVIGLIVVLRILPETRGRTLEQLEAALVHR